MHKLISFPIVCTITLIVNLTIPLTFGEDDTSSIRPNSLGFDVSNYVYDINSSPFNITYSDWTSKWWKWAYSIPKDIHPAFDDTGKFCQEGQNTPVWFFAGTYERSVIRYCEVPKDVGILFPILNSECSFIEHPKLKTKEELINCAKIIQDKVIPQYATLDKVEIKNLSDYRIQSNLFNFSLPENNILDLPAQMTQAVSDGNWVFLKPLPHGQHHLEFKGDVKQEKHNEFGNNGKYDDEFAGPIGWNYSITYVLNIK